ncbi:hypothetical protein GGR52DRAFT_566344 [Hypoxylon sp. FL1284]|nr:hypothetical protein GGR52DRAFT_566344 [Hypoxylon sp. FL1284]
MVSTPTYAGGFLPRGHTSLPSPAPSSTSSRAAAGLPNPRSKPLVRGSRKEDYARNYVSDRLLRISRRYVKKHGIPDPADEVTGYQSMDEMCKDIEEIVDLLWFTSTPSLEIPYLLNIAGDFNTYLPAFPPSPRPTFALLKKLDHCFASLIQGRDVKSGEPLPGFEKRGYATVGFTRTDMVRCKSIADETRMVVAMVMSGEPGVTTYADADDDEIPVSRAPTRRNVGVSISTGLIQSPVGGSIDGGSDSEMDTETDDIKSEDGDSNPSTTTKRKYGDTDTEDDARDESKRVKAEDDDEGLSVTFSDVAAKYDSPNPSFMDGPAPAPTGQFQFMGDDDPDTSDDEIAAPANTTARAPVAAVAPPTVQTAPDTELLDGEVDEEEEELQLNVGKVYERTLVQIGQSLGESLMGDELEL